ncbi:MAG: DUF465 domain-containing protein [Beijerinckiaceae bacterium]|jgi:hypothetical protein|nr:DUF465 domain-containing protein [Beijerinckiaceae bacterium]
MSQSSHLAQLERKHRALDDELRNELAHAARNETRIASIKRQKLVLKDEITRLRTGKPPEKRHLH